MLASLHKKAAHSVEKFQATDKKMSSVYEKYAFAEFPIGLVSARFTLSLSWNKHTFSTKRHVKYASTSPTSSPAALTTRVEQTDSSRTRKLDIHLDNQTKHH